MTDLVYPPELRYTADHEWARLGAEGLVRVGITAHAQDALGEVVYVTPPSVGDAVTAGQVCAEVESPKAVSEVYSPIDGEVSAVNDELATTPALINTDTYGQGWIFEVRPADPAQWDGLLDAGAYEAQLH